MSITFNLAAFAVLPLFLGFLALCSAVGRMKAMMAGVDGRHGIEFMKDVVLAAAWFVAAAVLMAENWQ